MTNKSKKLRNTKMSKKTRKTRGGDSIITSAQNAAARLGNAAANTGRRLNAIKGNIRDNNYNPYTSDSIHYADATIKVLDRDSEGNVVKDENGREVYVDVPTSALDSHDTLLGKPYHKIIEMGNRVKHREFIADIIIEAIKKSGLRAEHHVDNITKLIEKADKNKFIDGIRDITDVKVEEIKNKVEEIIYGTIRLLPYTEEQKGKISDPQKLLSILENKKGGGKSRKTRGGDENTNYDEIVKQVKEFNGDVTMSDGTPNKFFERKGPGEVPSFIESAKNWSTPPYKNKDKKAYDTFWKVGQKAHPEMKGRGVYLVQSKADKKYYLVDNDDVTYNFSDKYYQFTQRNFGYSKMPGGKSKKLRKSSKTRRKSNKILKKGGFLGFENRGIFKKKETNETLNKELDDLAQRFEKNKRRTTSFTSKKTTAS